MSGNIVSRVDEMGKKFERLYNNHLFDWDGIMSVMDDSVETPKLNLTDFAANLIVGENLTTIYESLLIKTHVLAKKITANKVPDFPIKEVTRLSEGVSRQATSLRQLKLSLEESVPEMVTNVEEMEGKCRSIVSSTFIFIFTNNKFFKTGLDHLLSCTQIK